MAAADARVKLGTVVASVRMDHPIALQAERAALSGGEQLIVTCNSCTYSCRCSWCWMVHCCTTHTTAGNRSGTHNMLADPSPAAKQLLAAPPSCAAASQDAASSSAATRAGISASSAARGAPQAPQGDTWGGSASGHSSGPRQLYLQQQQQEERKEQEERGDVPAACVIPHDAAICHSWSLIAKPCWCAGINQQHDAGAGGGRWIASSRSHMSP